MLTSPLSFQNQVFALRFDPKPFDSADVENFLVLTAPDLLPGDRRVYLAAAEAKTAATPAHELQQFSLADTGMYLKQCRSNWLGPDAKLHNLAVLPLQYVRFELLENGEFRPHSGGGCAKNGNFQLNHLETNLSDGKPTEPKRTIVQTLREFKKDEFRSAMNAWLID